VEPLFITGWAHRALKEVARLPASRLGAGHYIGLVRAALDRPGMPVRPGRLW
jgi:hypothetical protein